MSLPFKQRKKRQRFRGFHPPGFNYCGPGTVMDGAPPLNPTDEVCYNHDMYYQHQGISVPGNLLGHYDGDEKFISDISELPSNRPFYEKVVGGIGKLIFQAKKAVTRDYCSDPVVDQDMPINRRRLAQLARRAKWASITSRPGRPSKIRKYFKSKYGNRFATKRPRNSFRRARRVIGKFMKRRMKKKVSSKILTKLRRAVSIATEQPRKLCLNQFTHFDFQKLPAGGLGPNQYNRAFWVVPGESGGQIAGTALASFAGATYGLYLRLAELTSLISKFSAGGAYGAPSLVNHTYLYNWVNRHVITNLSNARITFSVYKFVAKIDSSLTIIGAINANASNGTIYPNNATDPLWYANTNQNWGVSSVNWNPLKTIDCREYYHTKLLKTITLDPNSSFTLVERIPALEINSRIWTSDVKKYVTRGHIIRVEGQLAKNTTDLLGSTSYPGFAIRSSTNATCFQTALRDYISVNAYDTADNDAVFTALAVDQIGQADVAMNG